MAYLDVLVGFSLVMLVFASAVSVAQSWLKRLLTIKGRALATPLVDELGRDWRALGLPEAGWAKLRPQMTASIGARDGRVGLALRSVPVSDGSTILTLLLDEGSAMVEAENVRDWHSVVARLRSRWRGLSQRLADSYELHTRRWVLALSILAALACNVDAIRILRLLSVTHEERARLAPLADRLARGGAALDGPEMQPLRLLSSWQRENLADLTAVGLPLGWEKAPWVVCAGPLQTLASGLHCDTRVDAGETAWLWLQRLLGLLVGAGLIAQGAPTWYSVFDAAIRLKKSIEKIPAEAAGP